VFERRTEPADEGRDQQQGALSIVFADGSRCILSAQPSVRQLWMAVASRGIAFHFNHDGAAWIDDKGRGIEALSYLKTFVKEQSGVILSL
jgi:CyaY protein